MDILDFDLYRHLIRINGKGQKQRFVPLTNSILLAFKNYIEQYKYTFNEELKGRVVRTIEGEKASKNTISLMFRRLRKKLNFDIYPHLLRHTFATLFLLNGGDIISLQHILGHTTLQMVLQYLHLATLIQMSSKSIYSPLSNMQNPTSSYLCKKITS